jgi:hypothetical protein
VIKITSNDFERILQERSIENGCLCFLESDSWKGESVRRFIYVFLPLILSIIALVFFGFFFGTFTLIFTVPLLVIFSLWSFWSLQNPSGIILDRGGLSYRNDSFNIFIPWGNLERKKPVMLSSKGEISLNLLSTVPGKGYIVKNAYFETRDITDEPPFELKDKKFLLNPRLEVSKDIVVGIIELRFKKYCRTVLDKVPVGRSEYCVILEKSNLDKNIVTFKEEVEKFFPSFCPITGEECDKLTDLTNGSSKEFLWMLSSSAERVQKMHAMLRIISCFLAFIAYFLYGYFILFSVMPDFYEGFSPLFHATIGLAVFFLAPLVWFFTREKIIFYKRNLSERTVSMKFEDDDYYMAFVDLNVDPDTQLPWRVFEED